MNNLITNTNGIDKEIQSLQTWLYAELIQRWGDSIDAYGRVYKNASTDGGLKAEWYLGHNEYKDVLYNDKFGACMMFIDDDNHDSEDGLVFSSDVKAVFMVDLNRILPDNSERADAKAQNDVVQIIRDSNFDNITIKGIEKIIGNVFRGFDVSNIKFSDIHPYHCFAVDLEMSYYMEDSCS